MDNVIDDAQLVLQHKKDQFRVEIRKKKTDNLIQQKRIKLFNKGLNPQDDNDSKSEQYGNSDTQNGQRGSAYSMQMKSTLDVQVLRDLEERLVQMEKENNIEQMQNLLHTLTKTIGCKPSPIDQVFMTGLPKIIVSIVNKSGPITDHRCRCYAAHILANLTSGSSEQLQELFKLGLLPILLEWIQAKDPEMADHVVWAFNNVLTDNHHSPQFLIRVFQERYTIVEDLCYYFTTTCKNPTIQYQLMSSVIQAIYQLSRIYQFSKNHQSEKNYYQQLRIAVPYLANMLDTHHPKEPNTVTYNNNNNNSSNYNNQPYNGQDQIQQYNVNSNNNNSNNDFNNSNNNQMSSNNNSRNSGQSGNGNQVRQVKQKYLSSDELKMCILMIAELSDGDPRVISDMLRIQVDRIMLRYLEQGVEISENFLILVLRTIANLSSGNEFQTDQLLLRDIYSYLNRFLEHQNEQIRRDVCWLISNLSAGNQQQIEVFLNKQMFKTLVLRLNVEQSGNVKKEILFALSNATAQASKEQINTMVVGGLLRILSENLDSQFPTELLFEILEGIENIMSVGRSEDMNNASNAFKNEFEGCGCQKKIQDMYYQHSNDQISEICCRILQFYGSF